ncbi:hypothetical protein EB796_014469 [Bugula neritina]|uniref:Uncharacterized protein n=1 Tax=Bugula neritina TaxID=10212 RepID=A0A7J7JNK5_BUGNE|nr:hypothetical protein EB796_014469 [Bugula neritina]
MSVNIAAIRKKLAETLADRNTLNLSEKKSIAEADPHPRSTDDEENRKFKRVLTKWMERELGDDSTNIR